MLSWKNANWSRQLLPPTFSSTRWQSAVTSFLKEKLNRGEQMVECALCSHPLQGRLEAEFIAGDLSVPDIVEELAGEIDVLKVLLHFQDHESKIDVEARKKRSSKNIPVVSAALAKPYVNIDDVDALTTLAYILGILKTKFEQVIMTKHIQGMGVISKEIRETLKEIERVKKVHKASLADRTEELFTEHRGMNRFLMHNLCTKCTDKYELFLKGEFETKAEVATLSEDRINIRTDANTG